MCVHFTNRVELTQLPFSAAFRFAGMKCLSISSKYIRVSIRHRRAPQEAPKTKGAAPVIPAYMHSAQNVLSASF